MAFMEQYMSLPHGNDNDAVVAEIARLPLADRARASALAKYHFANGLVELVWSAARAIARLPQRLLSVR